MLILTSDSVREVFFRVFVFLSLIAFLGLSSSVVYSTFDAGVVLCELVLESGVARLFARFVEECEFMNTV